MNSGEQAMTIIGMVGVGRPLTSAFQPSISAERYAGYGWRREAE